MPLSRSSIENYTADHLTSTADYLNKDADLRDQVFSQSHNKIGSLNWDGEGNDGAQSYSATSLASAMAHTAQMREAAAAHTAAAEAVMNAKNGVLGAIHLAEQDQFSVGEDFSVKDTMPEQVQVFREPYLHAHAGAIRAQVGSFVTQEQTAATTLHGHAATLGGFQMTDFKTDVPTPNPIAPWDTPDKPPAPSTALSDYPQSVLATPPTGGVKPPMPGVPLIPQPPVMTAMDPDEPWHNLPQHIDQPLDPVSLFSAGIKGGVAGGTAAAIAAATAPPLEPVAIVAGALTGAQIGIVTQAISPWIENTLHDIDESAD